MIVTLSLPPPQGAIIIHEVYEEGAASKDGRLWAGDQILEVPCDVRAPPPQQGPHGFAPRLTSHFITEGGAGGGRHMT